MMSYVIECFNYIYFFNCLIFFAGRVNIDFEKEPLSTQGGKPIFLSDIWPSRKEVQDTELNLGIFSN